MTTIEDKLRQALELTAEEIPAAAVSPLSLAPRPRGRQLRAWLSHSAGALRNRPVRWVAPVAAAMAVAAVISLAVAVGGREQGGGWLADLGPGTTYPLRTAPAFDGGAVPAYYVLTGNGSAQVLATATGAVLATIRPPSSAGSFGGVAAAADDRTFVLANTGHRQTTMFLLRLDPAAGIARLDALPIAVPTGSSRLTFPGLALSPDGTKLAAAYATSLAAPCYCDSRIWVYDLATGSSREWLWHRFGYTIAPGARGQGSLSWAADNKTLGFQMETGSRGVTTEVWLLDTAAPGTNLLTSQVALVSEEYPGVAQVGQTLIASPLLAADGTKIVLGKYRSAAERNGYLPETLSVEVYSVRTGKLVTTSYLRRYDLGQVPPRSGEFDTPPPPQVLWADPTGTVLVVAMPGPAAHNAASVGVLRQGRFTLLHGPGGALVTAASGTAAW